MVDIAIIGGGPAGLAAGLYAARGGAKVVLFEELFVGGQTANIHQIDNYPGFEEGIAGSELGMRMEKQATRFGLEIRYEGIRKIEPNEGAHRLHTKKEVVEARTVIYAMGARPRALNVPREPKFVGAGISYCATCDGAFFRNRDVAVVGGGDTALSDALYLARFASKVYLVHRRDSLRGSAILQKAVFAEQKIELVWSSVVSELLGEEQISGIRTKHVESEQERDIPVAALFVAVGTMPRSALVKEIVACNEAGYIVTDSVLRTNMAGMYAAGDVRDTKLRQVVTAVADGALAAMQALEYLTTFA